MALSDDQRAMLRLLAQREQGYDDLASLMGLSVEEVRVKVKDALDQLEEGETAPPLPPEPAAVPEEPPAPVEPAKPEPPVEPTPVAKQPSPAPAPSEPKPAPPVAAAKRSPSSPPRLSMPSGQGARAAIAAGVAVVVLVIVVLIVSGGDSSSDTSTSAAPSPVPSETTGETETTASGKDVTQAVLTAVDGSDASGTAVFGRVKNQLALQVEAEGLAPTKDGDSYTIWMADSPRKMLPLASTEVGADGKIGAQFEVPTEVLAYLAGETFDQISVTQTSDATLKASLAKATKEKKAPVYTGTEVLHGTITGPIIGAAKRAEEAKKNK